MNFINNIKLPISYYAFNVNWNLLNWDTRADIVMRYIDDTEKLDIGQLQRNGIPIRVFPLIINYV